MKESFKAGNWRKTSAKKLLGLTGWLPSGEGDRSPSTEARIGGKHRFFIQEMKLS